jgi:hypothetical protein
MASAQRGQRGLRRPEKAQFEALGAPSALIATWLPICRFAARTPDMRTIRITQNVIHTITWNPCFHKMEWGLTD